MRNRTIGTHPAIGIRPIIAARRGALGVRQSLEEPPPEYGQRAGTRCAIGGGMDGRSAGGGQRHSLETDRLHVALDVVCAALRRQGGKPVPHGLRRDEPLGRESRCHLLRAYRRGHSHALLDSVDSRCMHNVPAGDVFRPACWNAFGSDPERQDYRACATYGARFRKN